ncbi:MAG: AraC family transcriptional regulator [Eubacteriaceae bacterium]|nr:AraC family transcriptional regulator [Eubacteriaceae bacterium]
MQWIELLNKSIKYIEENLTGEIDYNTLGSIAACSSYHYQRMFTYMAGVPLSEYIRRRRMSLAAVDLMETDEKIIDIALKYGYSSPTAFNRAFQSVHGIAPSKVRGGELSVKFYPAITFTISIKGAEEMNYTISHKPPFRIVGYSMTIPKEVEESFRLVPKMWVDLAESGKIPELYAMSDSEPDGLLGACIEKGNELKYFIAVSSTKEPMEDMDESIIDAYTWAVFKGNGECPAAIQELERRIVTEWLPNSGYEYADGPDIEVYLSPDTQNAVFEVWLPVVKK